MDHVEELLLENSFPGTVSDLQEVEDSKTNEFVLGAIFLLRKYPFLKRVENSFSPFLNRYFIIIHFKNEWSDTIYQYPHEELPGLFLFSVAGNTITLKMFPFSSSKGTDSAPKPFSEQVITSGSSGANNLLKPDDIASVKSTQVDIIEEETLIDAKATKPSKFDISDFILDDESIGSLLGLYETIEPNEMEVSRLDSNTRTQGVISKLLFKLLGRSQIEVLVFILLFIPWDDIRSFFDKKISDLFGDMSTDSVSQKELRFKTEVTYIRDSIKTKVLKHIFTLVPGNRIYYFVVVLSYLSLKKQGKSSSDIERLIMCDVQSREFKAFYRSTIDCDKISKGLRASDKTIVNTGLLARMV